MAKISTGAMMYIQVYARIPPGMGKRRSIAEARTNLPQLVRDAEAGEEIELTRRGESVAVLVGREHYERLVSPKRRFSEAWSEFTRNNDLTGLDLDPDEIFAGVRDPDPGRDPLL